MPIKHYSKTNPPLNKLKQLAKCLKTSGATESTVQVLMHRMQLSPAERITYNILRMLETLKKEPRSSKWFELLQAHEVAVLEELDAIGVEKELMSAVHGLFNIHERCRARYKLGDAYDKAIAAQDERLRPLDLILGGD